jgi:hypothetical protein
VPEALEYGLKIIMLMLVLPKGVNDYDDEAREDKVLYATKILKSTEIISKYQNRVAKDKNSPVMILRSVNKEALYFLGVLLWHTCQQFELTLGWNKDLVVGLRQFFCVDFFSWAQERLSALQKKRLNKTQEESILITVTLVSDILTSNKEEILRSWTGEIQCEH